MADILPLPRRAVLAGMIASLLIPSRGFANTAAPDIRELPVPFDHARPSDGSFQLSYGLLAPFDAAKRTVFVIADGQQFFLSPAAFGPSVQPIFGDAFNVVGVFGRADAAEVQARVGSGADIDWPQAYRLLRAEQWLDDIEAIRVHLLGAEGRIGLYGRSGGGLLAHQFMARHGRHVDRVYTQAAVNPFLAARFGLASDRFWSELAPDERTRLASILANARYPRHRVAQLFQRQNFFVGRDELSAARNELIGELTAGDESALERREADYQIDAIAALKESARGPAIRVRLFEFFAPLASSFTEDPAVLRPDLENTAAFAEPLLPLLRAGAFEAPSLDFASLHALKAEVCLVAGRWDHTCDYRTQIALASAYPNGHLLLLDDDHVFDRFGRTGLLPRLVRGVMHGVGSQAYADARTAAEALIWRESS